MCNYSTVQQTRSTTNTPRRYRGSLLPSERLSVASKWITTPTDVIDFFSILPDNLGSEESIDITRRTKCLYKAWNLYSTRERERERDRLVSFLPIPQHATCSSTPSWGVRSRRWNENKYIFATSIQFSLPRSNRVVWFSPIRSIRLVYTIQTSEDYDLVLNHKRAIPPTPAFGIAARSLRLNFRVKINLYRPRASQHVDKLKRL